MRYATVRFGCGAVRCGAVLYICDRVRAKGPYGIEIDFEIRAEWQIAQISAKFRFSV